MVPGLTFGEALEAAKNGMRIFRLGWNGKNQFLSMAAGATIPASKVWSQHGRAHAELLGGEIRVAPSLTLKNSQDELVMGWVPSTGDLFAEDWVAEE
jgi:hypothetical protein